MAIEHEGLKGGIEVTDRWRCAFYDSVKKFGHTLAGLGADVEDFFGGYAQHLFDFLGVPVRFGGG